MSDIGRERFRMNDKYAKEIAKELKLIRKELEKTNNSRVVNEDNKKLFKKFMKENAVD